MYITDTCHFLDDKGAIAPSRGPAQADEWQVPAAAVIGPQNLTGCSQSVSAVRITSADVSTLLLSGMYLAWS